MDGTPDSGSTSDVLPDGSSLFGYNPDEGVVHVRGPSGTVIAYDEGRLGPGDMKMLGLDQAAPAAPAPNAPPPGAGATFLQGLLAGGAGSKDPSALAGAADSPNAAAAGMTLGDAYRLSAAPFVASTAAIGKGVAAGVPYLLRGAAGGLRAIGEGNGANMLHTAAGDAPAPPPTQPAPTGGQAQTPAPMARPPVDLPQRMQLQSSGRGLGAGATDFSKDANKGFADEQQALSAQGDAEAASAGGKAANVATDAQQQQQAMQDALARRQAVEAEYRQHMDTIDQAQAQLDKQKEDPNRLWNSFSGGQKVAATVSMFLGGLAEGFGIHGASPVPKMIEQDVEAQRQNYARAKDSLATKRTAYAQLRDQGLSDVDATLVLKRNMYDQVQRSADAQVDQRYAPPAVKARYQALKAEAQQKQAETDAQLQQSAAVTAHTKVATAAERQSMMIQGDQYAMQKRLLANGQLPPQLANRAVFVRGPDSQYRPMLAPDEKSAEKLKDMYGSTDSILKEIDEAKQLAQQFGSSSDKTKAGLTYKSKVDGIIGKINAAQGINQAVDREKLELYMKMLGNDATTPTASTSAALDGIAGTVRTGVNSAFGANGMATPFAEAPQSLQPLR